MKKKKSFIGGLIFSLSVLVGTLFIYLFTLNEIKMLNKEKDNLETLLSQKISKREMLIVELQRISSEDKIVKIATESIGLKRSQEVYKKIYLDEKLVERVVNIVNKKYE
ncbi:MAG: hypothetical protein CVV23_06195 [Ignavibacteriae bacterium HGW-Ignavibacteriae-2]|jgi:hypothetical protein|nr:MAG: hypothetical protein CVV23_06195 [Ignavibacteriae bacterium HGW-Ignavibacteriae-2]